MTRSSTTDDRDGRRPSTPPMAALVRRLMVDYDGRVTGTAVLRVVDAARDAVCYFGVDPVDDAGVVERLAREDLDSLAGGHDVSAPRLFRGGSRRR